MLTLIALGGLLRNNRSKTMNNMLAAVGGMIMIVFCAAIVVGALIFQKVYIDGIDESAISVRMEPFASNALVRNSDVGLQIKLRPSDNWSVVFDSNSVPIAMPVLTDGHLSQISKNVDDEFIARDVYSSGGQYNFLVLDSQFNIWHVTFDGQDLVGKSFVTKFVTHNTSGYAGAIDLID